MYHVILILIQSGERYFANASIPETSSEILPKLSLVRMTSTKLVYNIKLIMKPLISVIIPAYNEERLIGPCLESLKRQTLQKNKFEIIVVDNNSSD